MEENLEKTEEQILQEKLQELQNKKVEDCTNEINEVLKKYGFAMEIQYQFILKPVQYV